MTIVAARIALLATLAGSVLDRIDSLCFSAPVFFHLTRYFYAA